MRKSFLIENRPLNLFSFKPNTDPQAFIEESIDLACLFHEMETRLGIPRIDYDIWSSKTISTTNVKSKIQNTSAAPQNSQIHIISYDYTILIEGQVTDHKGLCYSYQSEAKLKFISEWDVCNKVPESCRALCHGHLENTKIGLDSGKDEFFGRIEDTLPCVYWSSAVIATNTDLAENRNKCHKTSVSEHIQLTSTPLWNDVRDLILK